MKLINSRLDELISKKGCDASNMFDEEVMHTEQEFSDDDDEKHAKKQRKIAQQKKRKRTDNGNSSSEDGEIVEDVGSKPSMNDRGRGGRGQRGGRGERGGRGQRGGHDNKRFRGRGGAITMPVYSTNQSIL